MPWRTLHLWFGSAGLLLFVLQGQYMQHVIDVPALIDGQRVLYRSGHLYCMLAAAINVCLGCLQGAAAGPTALQRLCSALLLLAPVLLWLSFFTELSGGSIDRMLASCGLYAIFAATGLMATVATWQRLKRAG